ncbi:MAG: hydrogenase maturation protease, partial [Anaerolineae bacterium]|nr:hydrogenase maturation protease [Anaerolineae bacterium]
DATIIEQSGEGTTLAEVLSGASAVILIDAVVSGAAPGTLLRFDANQQSLPAHFFAHSTHAFGVAEAIELARAFNDLPPRCLIFGIEGACFEWGTGLTQSVEQAGDQLVVCLAQAIKDHTLAVSLPCG